MGQEDFENVLLRTESEGLSIRSSIKEEASRNKIMTMELGKRFAVFLQPQKLQAAVTEHHVRAINAVHEALQESFERYQVSMLQDIQA